MRTFDPAIVTALAARRLRARDFLWIIAHDRSDWSEVPVGFWSGLQNVTDVPVLNPHTGSSEDRDWYGAGGLIEIPDIPATVGFAVSSIEITMSQLDEQVELAVRLYDVKQAEVQIFRGLFDPVSAALVAPAECRFIGFVDYVNILTPKEGEVGGVTLTCSNHTQELLRANPSTRSHADQQLRHAGDDFFKDADAVGEWGPLQWGPAAVKAESKNQKKGLLGFGGTFLGL